MDMITTCLIVGQLERVFCRWTGSRLKTFVGGICVRQIQQVSLL